MNDEDTVNELAQIAPEGRRRIIAAAVTLFDDHGDGDEILSSSQLEVLERLAPLAYTWNSTALAALDRGDLDAILTTAVELVDKHGCSDEHLRDAVRQYRHFTFLDDGNEDPPQ